MLPFPLLEPRRHVLLHKIQASMHRHHCCPAAQQAHTRYVAHHGTVTKVCLSGQAAAAPGRSGRDTHRPGAQGDWLVAGAAKVRDVCEGHRPHRPAHLQHSKWMGPAKALSQA